MGKNGSKYVPGHHAGHSSDGSEEEEEQETGSIHRSVPEEPPQPLDRQTTEKKIVRAMYDYQPRQSDDLAFLKGDRMLVLDISENSDDADWWLARHLKTGQTGYVPTNYIVVDDTSLQSQEWWFAVDRREADKLLMMPGNGCGTFLVRKSADRKTYVLCVRDAVSNTREELTRHYLVHFNSDQGVYHVNRKNCFNSLIELVEHYKYRTDGLHCRLRKACPRIPEPVPFKQLEVVRSEVELLARLGGGHFGEVHAGKWRRMVDVAVKTLKPSSMSPVEFLEEAKVMHRLRHPKLVQLMGVCTRQEPMYIITELMVNGSLLEYLRDERRQESLTMAVRVDMAAQISDGMAYLETQQYVHRDVRAANMLVGEQNIVKVADFGLARLTINDLYTAGTDAHFPIKWTAPEAALKKRFSVKSDVWSFGVCLYEIVTFGRIPYPAFDNATTLVKVKKGYRMPCPICCPVDLYGIMLRCWDREPANRPTFRYLHNFFDEHSSEAIYDERQLVDTL